MCRVIEGILPLKGGAAIFIFRRAREIISACGLKGDDGVQDSIQV